MPSFTLIGAGQVGKTLAYLLSSRIGLSLKYVLTTSLDSAQAACDFIGAGQAVSDYHQLTSTDYYLIATPDQQIRSCAAQLALTNLLHAGVSVMHCSGALSSQELASLQVFGVKIASLHPVKSFVDPSLSIETFPGTPCAIEGDADLCEVLMEWLQALQALAFIISVEQKIIYHSALVIASNYLVALTEAAVLSLQMVGIKREQAMPLLQPLMQHTLNQVFVQGTKQALSGPIARGDAEIVAKELQALRHQDANIADVYQKLGNIALRLCPNQARNSLLALKKALT